MIGSIARSSCISSATKATSYLFPTLSKSATPSTALVIKQGPSDPISPTIARVIPSGSGLQQTCAKSSLFGTQQLRYAHTDHLHEANFDEFQKQSSKQKGPETELREKHFTYVLGAAIAMPWAVWTKSVVTSILASIDLSQDVLALAQTEVDLTNIPEGKTVIVNWRAKPLFVRHRTAAEIEKENEIAVGSLRDPQHDHERSKRPEWVVVVGICTHLGCVPLANQGKFGGFFCPCHGSHYDTSGRIRVGPAPLNLEVPEHQFASDNLLVVG